MKGMNTMAKLMVACAVLSCVALVAAQGGGGGRGQGGRGFGQGMLGGGMDPTGLNLLRRADVQRDLGITDDQRTKLQALQERFGRGGGGLGRGGGGGGGGGGGFGGGGGGFDPAQIEARNAEIKKEIAGILKLEQVTRLHEINVQLAGNRAILNPDVQKALGIDASQKSRIDDLQRKMQEANQQLFQQMRDGGMDREQLQAAMQRNFETMNAELGKILTPAQAAKLKEMGGKEFKADPPQRPPL